MDQKELPFTLLCQLSQTTRCKDGLSIITNKRISIVDDDEPYITSLKVGLEYDEDDEFKVDTFNDSIAEQLNYKTAYYDLLLLDVKMPVCFRHLLYETNFNI